MNYKKIRKYLEKKYWKDKQKLQLNFHYADEEGRPRYTQCITCGDYFLCEIQTFNNLYDSQLGHTPYYINEHDWEPMITVQKFGELTDEDIHLAIHRGYLEYAGLQLKPGKLEYDSFSCGFPFRIDGLYQIKLENNKNFTNN